ncbi:hypothetical protein [Kitasatospora sp. NPDC087315]|uniref:hypothetical protein n=1 Tax=Kitasatospora sp. NPDC087315 TaxID=3364069 RepID=UPI0037FE5394
MHDDRTLVESRLKSVLEGRIRPAVHPESVPLEVGVWTTRWWSAPSSRPTTAAAT